MAYEPMATTRPQPRSRIPGRSAVASSIGAMARIWKAAAQPAASVSVGAEGGGPPGVEDEEGEAAEGIDGRRRERRRSRRVSEVRGQRDGPDPMPRGELRGDLREEPGAPRRDREVAALGREALGDRSSQPARGPADERPRAANSEIHGT